jgi:putative ABC transport system substrate-binding protein
MSYGTKIGDMFRLCGLSRPHPQGREAADLPAMRSTEVELIMILKTAKALGLTVPTALLVRADEVIE